MASVPRRTARQLDLYGLEPSPRRSLWQSVKRVPRPARPLCARCRVKDARYGFEEEEGLERPRTLCFECFRLEIVRRQQMSGQATTSTLPLDDTLRSIDLRRRRAQIAARRVLGI
jgi:hypothetical protein